MAETTKLAAAHKPVQPGAMTVGGFWGQCLEKTLDRWLLRVNNDLLLSGFRQRPGMQAWIGEHAGKYLLAAVPSAELLRSEALRAKERELVEGLITCQEPDGYLGTYLPEDRWLGFDADHQGKLWDTWVHKYCILALLAYYGVTGWAPALEAARKAGNLVVAKFGPGGLDINNSDVHTGLVSGSVLEAIMRLYQRTGEQHYLTFARHLLARWGDEKQPNPTSRDAVARGDGPKLIAVLRAGGDVSAIGNGKAYEMMSCLVGLAEYVRATGEQEYLGLLLRARDSIADWHRYATGGMSVTEHFWRPGLFPEWANLETCVAFTWIQLNLRLFELTGDERALDLVEEAAWNELLPALSPEGDTWSYYLSMTGPKRFFRRWVQEVTAVGDMYNGAPISCCHTNGQRGLALVPQWMYTVTGEGRISINLFGESSAEITLPGVGRVRIDQHTDLPRSGTVVLHAVPERAGTYELRVRRPAWTRLMTVDGQPVAEPQRYLSLQCQGETTIRITLLLRPRILMCGLETRGKCAVAYGPLVMALDKAPEGLSLDQVALAFGRGDPADCISVATMDDWPALDVPAASIPAAGVSEASPVSIGTVRLTPVLLAGLEGNPGLQGIVDASQTPDYNAPNREDRLFPAYRVLLPFFWSPATLEAT